MYANIYANAHMYTSRNAILYERELGWLVGYVEQILLIFKVRHEINMTLIYIYAYCQNTNGKNNLKTLLNQLYGFNDIFPH